MEARERIADDNLQNIGERRTSFEHVIQGCAHIVKVSGEVDVYTSPLFTAAIKKASNSARIIVDLTNCRYVDASAISALVRARKDCGVPIHLVIGDESIIRRVLRITNVDRLFPIFSTLDAAAAPRLDRNAEPGEIRHLNRSRVQPVRPRRCPR